MSLHIARFYPPGSFQKYEWDGILPSVLRRPLTAIILGLFLLTGCGPTPAVMPSPNVSIYLLDLTRSGKASEQFERIQEDLVRSVTLSALGNPYEELGPVTGPSVSRMYFVGGNSLALRDFKLQNTDIAYELHDFVALENNATRSVKFWKLLSKEYGDYIKAKFEFNEVPTRVECQRHFDLRFSSTWSSQSLRENYSGFLCESAIYSLSNFSEMKYYIESESRPGTQKASDVFGALSKVASTVKTYKKQFSDITITLTLATDGDHRLGDSYPRNLKVLLAENTNACEVASQVKREYGLAILEPKKWLKVETRGIGALIRGKGDYPRQLNDFWQRCFFPQI